jgi:hypothetical protein
MSFEDNLDALSKSINKSRNKLLKSLYVEHLAHVKGILDDYYSIVSVLSLLQESTPTSNSKYNGWDTTLVGDK